MKFIRPHWTHRSSKTPEYAVWGAMVARCTNPKSKSYARYGAIGVTVCDLWRYGTDEKSAFSFFIEEVGPRPSSLFQLDRINTTKGYEPGNVRWATRVEQANNKRNNLIVSYRGQQMTLADAVRAAGSIVSRATAGCRVRNGWTVQEAIETPHLFNRDSQGRKIRNYLPAE